MDFVGGEAKCSACKLSHCAIHAGAPVDQGVDQVPNAGRLVQLRPLLALFAGGGLHRRITGNHEGPYAGFVGRVFNRQCVDLRLAFVSSLLPLPSVGQAAPDYSFVEVPAVACQSFLKPPGLLAN